MYLGKIKLLYTIICDSINSYLYNLPFLVEKNFDIRILVWLETLVPQFDFSQSK